MEESAWQELLKKMLNYLPKLSKMPLKMVDQYIRIYNFIIINFTIFEFLCIIIFNYNFYLKNNNNILYNFRLNIVYINFI